MPASVAASPAVRACAGPIGRPAVLAAPAVLWVAACTVAPFFLLHRRIVLGVRLPRNAAGLPVDELRANLPTDLYVLQLLKTLRIALVSTTIALVLAYPVTW